MTAFKDFREGLDPTKGVEDWLAWPPDVFLLTSLVLRRTGCYRYAVSGPGQRTWPDEANWNQAVESTANRWIAWALGETIEMPQLLESARRTIEKGEAGVHLQDLGNIASEADIEWEFCKAILTLHSLADAACAGFGCLSCPPNATAVMHCLANLLLSVHGSLSRVPKHVGVVLPKMRTPQSGLTLRSFSHHVTFHESEVQIAWRAVPWVNIDENLANILIVPWPFEVEPKWFIPKQETFRHVRRFKYAGPNGEEDGAQFHESLIIDCLKQALQSVNRVHVIVFPELALTESDIARLQNALAEHYEHDRDRIPMIVSGLRGPTSESCDYSGDSNRLILSIYFADKWYNMYQEKHHRWMLDRNQILQYGLEGVLSTQRQWREKTEIGPRRLTCLGAYRWLTVAPLICEDLAQLEPVSEVIRGIGPTLVIALLLDGPQRIGRWSSRYASVLADDPGSSVLTVTSLGMAVRCVPEGKNVDRTVALWRDQLTGWHSIELPEKAAGVILTVEADWREQFTADGRSDHRNTAVFRYQGHRILWLDEASDATVAPAINVGDARDISELTAGTFFVDAALDADRDSIELLKEVVLGDENYKATLAKKFPATFQSLREILIEDFKRGWYLSHSKDKRWPAPDLRWALESVVEFLTKAPSDIDTEERWKTLVDLAVARLNATKAASWKADPRALELGLDEQESRRIEIAVSLSILSSVHNRIDRTRVTPTVQPDWQHRRLRATVLREIEVALAHW